MTSEPADTTVRLRHILRPIRRYWLLFIAIVALATAAGLAVGASIPSQYTATATLVVSPITTNPFSSTAPTQTININTEREILRSSEVARIASESLGDEISADSTLLNQVDVAAPSGSQVLQVSVQASTPDEAAESANALADAYLAFRGQGASEIAVAFIDAIDQQLSTLQGLEDAGSRAAIASLEEQRASLAIVGDNPGRLIGRAIPPTSPSSLGLPVFLVAGLVGGLIIAPLLVTVWARIDPRLRFADRLVAAGAGMPLSIKSPADLEGGRWVLREFDAARARGNGDTLAVAVFATGELTAATAIRAFAACAVSEGRSVVIYLADDFSPDDLSWGWPDSEALEIAGGDMILIDGSLITSGARRATLADRVTLSVVATSKKSRVRTAREVVDDLGASASPVLAVFFERSRPEAAAPQTESVPRPVEPAAGADSEAADADGGAGSDGIVARTRPASRPGQSDGPGTEDDQPPRPHQASAKVAGS